jgi:thiol:disulfide interchange protein
MTASSTNWKGYLSPRWAVATCALLLLAVLETGCGLVSDKPLPESLREVPSYLVERHGSLHFVLDPAVGCQVAAKQGLPCLLFFTAEWCTYCHQMEGAAFRDAAVSELAEGFICILVDADREPRLCEQYGVSGFPTVQFIAADGRSLHRLVGRQSAAELATGMRAAGRRFAWLTGSSSTVR